MAYPILAVDKTITPIFDNMIQQKVLAGNIFAFYLTKAEDEKRGSKSDLTFGYYDTRKFTGEISWNNVEYPHFFGVKLDDILFNGVSSKICEDGRKCLIAFDSGLSLMSMSKSAISFLA